jgi:hypothetical protein
MTSKAYTVYWIHSEDHEDPFGEGYVGITANFEYRIQRYKQRGQKSHLQCRFDAGAKVRVLAKNLLHTEALLLERKLRPKRNIGWNKNSGGFMPPIPTANGN